MRHDLSSRLDNWLLGAAWITAALGALLMVMAAARGLAGSPFEFSGWLALLASSATGSVAIIRKARVPARQLEDRARELARERRNRTDAEWLRRVAERAALLGDPEDTLADIARMEADILGLDRSRVVLYNRQEFGLEPLDDAPSERVWEMVWESLRRTGEGAVYVERREVPHGAAGLMDAEGAGGVLLTPLRSRGLLSGFIVLLLKPEESRPSPQALELAGTIGRQASLVLENAYLYQQSKNRADNLETIFRISQAVGSSLQSRVVLNRVLDVVQKILSADAVMLLRYDSNRRYMTVPMARGIVSKDMLEATYRPGEGIAGRVFETREPELYDDICDDPSPLLADAAERGLRSALAVPLLTRGRSIGVLVVLSRSEAAFGADELDLLGTFASQAALAIDNAELFSREHDTVRVLQESILPVRLPEIPGIESASIYLPGARELEIGGDYYDLFSLPGSRVALTIGDVCGKGVHAATRTSMLRHAVRGMLVAGLDPASAFVHLNKMLIEQDDVSTSILTLWLGCLDTSTGRLTYADGGHPPALVMAPNRTIARLEPTGPLLGGVPSAEWALREVELQVGSLLMLYTDGVTEARRGTRFFGEGRVRRALHAGGNSAAIAERLLASIERFTAGEVRDDAAIMVVRYSSVTDSCQDVTRAHNGGK